MNYHRFFQFRFATLLGLMTGVAIGFAPLKLWEVWRAPSPMIFMQVEIVEVDTEVLQEEPGQKDARASILEQLAALRERGELDILSRPQIMTLDGQGATIQVGSEMPVVAGSSVSMRFVGLNYQLTPKLQRNGLIRLNYTADVSDQNPDASTRVSGQLEVRQNEPVVICGSAHGDGTDRQRLVVLTANSTDPNSAFARPKPRPFSTVARPSTAPRRVLPSPQ
jgi:type II/III secretion system protein